jgi:hypothetical protein
MIIKTFLAPKTVLMKMNNYKVIRLEICKSCEYFHQILRMCSQCGCFMPAKILIKSSSCPIKKWSPVDGNDNTI